MTPLADDEPGAATEKAARAYRRAEQLLEQRREELAAAIVADAKAGVRPTRLVELSTYDREHVRRILRAAGVQPSRSRSSS